MAEDLVHSSSIGLGSIQNDEDVMNIYVGNLPFTITEDKLKDLFVDFGEVTRINLITDKATGELRGFGFVEIPTQSEAEAAIKGLNGTSVGGMTIQVTSPVTGVADDRIPSTDL
jgi:RNA recognition motif-containing protein